MLPDFSSLDTFDNPASTPTVSYSSKKKEYPTPLKFLRFKLRNYLTRAQKGVPAHLKAEVEAKLQDIVLNATSNNTLWTTNWDTFPLPEAVRINNDNNKPKNDNNIPEKRKYTHPALQNQAQMNIYDNHDDYSEFSHLAPAQRQAEIERLQQRMKRFKSQDDLRELQQKNARLEIAKKRAQFLAAGAEGNPGIIDWDKDTIVGTCTKLYYLILMLLEKNLICALPLHLTLQQ